MIVKPFTIASEFHKRSAFTVDGQRCWKGVRGGVYKLIEKMEFFWPFYEQLKKQKRIAVDTETSGLNWVHSEIAGIVIGWDIENNYYLAVGHKTGEAQLSIDEIKQPLQEVFESEDVTKVFWNAKFDKHFLCKAGFDIYGPQHDGVLLVHLLDENSVKGLKPLSERYIDERAGVWEDELHEWRQLEARARRTAFSEFLKSKLTTGSEDIQEFYIKYPEVKFSGETKNEITAKLKEYVKDKYKDHLLSKNGLDDISYDYIPLDVIAPYACADTHYTLILFNKFYHEVYNHESLRKLYENELELAEVLYEVESGGIKIDTKYLQELIPQMENDIKEAEQAVYKEIGYEFDISSNDQLVKALLDVGVQLTKLTKKGKEAQRLGYIDKLKYAVDAEVLEYLATKYPAAQKVLDYRSKMKILNTYVLGILELLDSEGYIHSTYNANVSTGRMSSNSPNFQNIPNADKTIRRAVVIP